MCNYHRNTVFTTVNLHQHINSSVFFFPPLGSKSVNNVEALFPRHMHMCRRPYALPGPMPYQALCPTRPYALPGPMPYQALCPTRPYALPGPMPYQALCPTRPYALPGPMPYQALCPTRPYALPGPMPYQALCPTRPYALPGPTLATPLSRGKHCFSSMICTTNLWFELLNLAFATNMHQK